jgi:ATP-dependent Clp protease ATP-binding subunit ClpB
LKNNAQSRATYQALERYGRDLTALASQGKLDPVIGRDEGFAASSKSG